MAQAFMRSLRLFVYSVAVDGFLEAADALRVEIMSASSLASGHLDPLPVFPSVASAERYIDKLAATLGLSNRVGCCWAEEPMIRKLKYEDGGNLELTVSISPGNRLEGKPCWYISASAKRKDVGLCVEIPRRLRPLAFKKEATELLARVRGLRIHQGGRLLGKLTNWKRDKGYGYLECLPGSFVYVSREELVRVRFGAPNPSSWFSFQVESSLGRQKAVNLLPHAPRNQEAVKCWP